MIETTAAPRISAAPTPTTHMLAGVALPEQEQAPRPGRSVMPSEAPVVAEAPGAAPERAGRNDRRTRLRAAHNEALSRSGEAALVSRANDTAEFIANMRAEIGRHESAAASGGSFLQRALRRR